MSWSGLENRSCPSTRMDGSGSSEKVVQLGSLWRHTLYIPYTNILINDVRKEEFFLTLVQSFLFSYLSFQQSKRRRAWSSEGSGPSSSWAEVNVLKNFNSFLWFAWNIQNLKTKLQSVKECTWRYRLRWTLSYRFYTINFHVDGWTSLARSWKKLWRISFKVTGIPTSLSRWAWPHRK